jgi:hypothetical protein
LFFQAPTHVETSAPFLSGIMPPEFSGGGLRLLKIYCRLLMFFNEVLAEK